MKKTFILSIVSISLLLFISSCNLQIPENISVKTQAQYEFGAGNFNKSLDEMLDIKKMLGDDKALKEKGILIYDYFPGQENINVQRYLMKIPVAEISLDFNSYLEEMDFTSNFKNLNFEKDIEIPLFKTNPVEKSIPVSTTDASLLKNQNILVKIDLPELVTESSGLISCKINEGFFDIKIEGVDSSAEYTINVTTEGALTLGADKVTNQADTKINLLDAELTKGPSVINATINFSKLTTVSSPKIVMTTNISTLKTVTADTKAKTDFNNTNPLPTKMTDSISALKMKPSGVEITYTNNLPANSANNIGLTSNSTFLGISSKVSTLEAGQTNTIPVKCENNHSVTINAGGNVDFNVDVKLPGTHPGHPSYITVEDIEIGKKYKIKMEAKPVFDWNTATIKDEAFNQFNKNNETKNLGINLNKMLSDLGEKFGNKELFTKLELKELPIYVTCVKPAGLTALNGIVFEGKGKLMSDVKDIEYIFGDAGNDATIPALTKTPELNLNGDIVTADFKKFAVGTDVSIAKSLSKPAIKTLMTTNGELKMIYSMSVSGAPGGAGGVEVSQDQLQDTAKIGVEAYVDLGFDLVVPEGGIPLDLAKLMNLKPEEDMLKGNLGKMKEKGIDKAVSAVKEVGVTYDLKSIPYYSKNEMQLSLNVDGLESIDMNLKNGNFSFTKEQITKLFELKEPAFKIKSIIANIPQGDFSVPRAKKIETSLGVKLVTDGTIKIFEGGQPAFGGEQ